MLNQSLSTLLLAASLNLVNALPSPATPKISIDQQLQSVTSWYSGQWCFKFTDMGLFCYSISY
ncbi:MAG: hypothetical protein AAFN00_20585 [Cyanobacteria bacterium J06558_2]